ncbi:MAG TPA: FliH/SctL family protein [Thermoguttaceae bacterium]
MSTIIRASDYNSNAQGVAFNFDDMAVQADQYLARIRADAAKIIVKAQQEAEGIRKRAESEGRQAAMQAVEEMVQKQLATVIPALRQAVEKIQDARHAWLSQWESGSVHLAAEIAKRLIRRELKGQPEITLTLVREALELAAGNTELRILLNPLDLQSLGNQVQCLVDELSPHIKVEIKDDPEVTPGGCRVETRFGAIDQQFEAQLQRIEEELKQ